MPGSGCAHARAAGRRKLLPDSTPNPKRTRLRFPKMERPLPADSATLRGARAVGIVCATLFVLPVILSIAFPSAFLFQPYNRTYERMIAAVLLAFGLGLLLALRDPVRNAGVFAVVGLATGLLGGAVIYALVVDQADPLHWVAQVPILAAITATLVITYTRLRRPNPIVVRIVVAAVVLLPFVFFVHDLAYAAFVASR